MNILENAENSREPASSPTEHHVARIRAGDGGGFAELYQRLTPSLQAWAQLRVSGTLRDFVEPGDVIQEVWWRAMDAFPRYDPSRSSFRAWVFTIATNVLLEWNRKRRRKLKLEPRALALRSESLPPDLARQATSVGQRLGTSESVRKLVAVVAGMSEEDRAVFIHCGLEGLTAAETADVVGSTAEAIKKRWQRLRERLEPNPVWAEFAPES